MRNRHGKHKDTGLTKHLIVSVLFLFFSQLSLQIFSFFFLINKKEGLISARLLLWQGLQTGPVIRAMLYYLLVYLVLLTILSAIALLAARFMVIRLKIRESVGKVTILLLLYASLMVINTFHYPHSIVRFSMANDWLQANNYIPYYIAAAFLLIVLAAACLEATITSIQKWQLLPRQARRLASTFSLVVILVVVGFQYLPGFAQARISEQQDNQRPNIILIGLDSVRLDVIENEKLRKKFLPRLSKHLDGENTAWFTNAFTPIARTFAAWYALLSGNEPKTSGVRYNLQQLTEIQKTSTIVPLLAKQGYYTMYGSDEKRFSNIDESYGFDDTFGPPPGAAEWVMSFLEDSPVHNLLRGTVLARVLLPYTNANRASFTVYQPEDFVREVEYKLSAYEYGKPLFLSVHLCLSHWPYTWGKGGATEKHPKIINYFDSLQALDTQFGDIMNLLANSGLLKNAVVVVFTDHGEGLISQNMLEGDPRMAQLNDLLPAANDLSHGHGTDLLTISQNKILMSVRDYSNATVIPPGRHDTLSSLLDIAPTLARIGGVLNYRSDGLDLSVVANGTPTDRLVFMETGFDLAALHRADLDINLIVQQGASTYEISEKGFMQVKPEFHDHIISNKQKGVTDGSYIVANNIGSSLNEQQNTEFLGVNSTNPENQYLPENAWTEELIQLKEQLIEYYIDEW